MSVNPTEHDPADQRSIEAELGRLVLCRRPLDMQRLAEDSAVGRLARRRFPDSTAPAARLLDRLLGEAIEAIGIEEVEHAADALLTDQYGPRWVPLADRQERAATALSDLTGGSLTRDGFRRKRTSDGRSRQDDVVEHLAMAILGLAERAGDATTASESVDDSDGDPAPIAPVTWPASFRPEPDVGGSEGADAASPKAATTGRRAAAAAAAVAAVAAVIVVGIVGLVTAGVVLTGRRGSNDATDTTASAEAAYECPIAPAEAAPGLDAAPEQIEFLARTLADHLDETGMACPDRLADFWAETDLIVQPLSSPSTGWTGALVATPEQMGFTLTAGQWAGLLYAHEHAAANEQRSFVPLDEEHREGASWVEAEAGWLVGERWGQPHFLVDGPWLRVWERNGRLDGRLGRPTSFVYDDGEVKRQDFAGGYLSATAGDDPTPRFDNTKAPPPVRPGDRIQQPDGTEWLIGTDRQRIWAGLAPYLLPTTCSTAHVPPATGGRRAGVHRIDGTRAARVPLSPSCTF